MANAVMQTGRSNGTRGENYDYAFKVSYIRPVFFVQMLLLQVGFEL